MAISKRLEDEHNIQCSLCKKMLPKTEFHSRNASAEKPILHSACKTCISNKVKLTKQIARNYINNYLSQHPCCICGESRIYCLDFDHLDPNSKYKEIAKLVGCNHSLKTLKAEIEKCRVLCANCHREHTAQTQQWSSWNYEKETKANQR